jgi:hypothetical protein
MPKTDEREEEREDKGPINVASPGKECNRLPFRSMATTPRAESRERREKRKGMGGRF